VILNGPVIWVDPGAPSGYAVVDPRDWHFQSGELHMLALGEVLRRRCHSSPVSALGWEAFTIRPGTSRITTDTSAPETIGMLRWLAYYYNIPVLPAQNPDAMVLGQLHLKAVGWYNPGLGDANSAAGHLLAYLLKNHLLPQHLLEKITAQLGGERL
jgi:hypothetical protein